MLPINDKLKHDLIERFDSMDVGEKHDLITAVWAAYDTLHQDKIDMKFFEKFEQLSDGERGVGDFYKESVDEINKEDAQVSEKVVREDELTNVRNKLKTIIAAD